MKRSKIFSVIFSLVLFTACGSGQSAQTSETVSATESTAVTAASQTTAAKTETSAAETVPADNDTAFDDELASALADIIEQHNGGRFFMYDFNRDGCPEIAFYGHDMLTAYFNIYDFSGGEAVSMGTAVPGECSQNTDIDCCCELYFNADNGEYLYVSLPRYADSLGTLTDHYLQGMYRTELSLDMKFDPDDRRDFYTGTSEEEWYAERDKAWAGLSEYTLIEHIDPEKMKTYTVYDPSPYDPSPKELAVTVLKEYYAEIGAASENAEQEYVRVSANNEFIDFDFIADYRGTDDIGDLADKAIQYLADEFIAKTTDWKFLFSEVPDTVPDEFADYVDGDGKIIPKFKTAYPNDYDGDGRTETFFVLNAPRFEYGILQSYLFFADSNGNTELIDSFCREYPVTLLNYGRDKQIIFGGEGEFGVETHCSLFGVKDGKAVAHYRLRGGFKKDNCFLSASGWQGCGAMMYYDTAEREYRAIVSEDISVEDVKDMDSTGVFAEYYSEDCPFAAFQHIGDKYYLLIKQAMMDYGEPYKYENGKFIKLENSGIRMSLDHDGLPRVKDFDIDKAVSEMKKTVEPFVKVSPDNEFIDYEFIEDYRGTDDIGDLADKAVEYIKTTDLYAESMGNIERINTEKLGEEWGPVSGEFYQRDVSIYFDKDGNIRPVVSAAYTADYDGDGRTETFIVVDIPYIVWSYPDVWSLLLFADSDGNIRPDVIDFYEGYSASMLDYGKNKHLIFGGSDGMHSYASIYGVKNGKPVTLYDHCPGGYFRKTDCFLSAFGLQGGSDFMYFDTAVREYRVIKGVELSLDEMKELDVSGTLCSHCNAESLDDLPDYVEFHFIKPNYYLIDWGFPGSHLLTYENGVFTYDKDSNITRSSNYSKLDAVAEFDIDKAVSEMRPVQK